METPSINNAFYETLGDRWYTAEDDPVALLRAESRVKNPWILRTLAEQFPNQACRVLDVGCGAGFLVRDLANAGHDVMGIDLSAASLETFRRQNPGLRADLRCMSAYELESLPAASFDAVCAMDFLEHVNEPAKVIRGASHLLKPDGLFFFHTFNRGFLSWLLVIKSLEWFVANTPERMHVHSLFIKPSELARDCAAAGLEIELMTGMRPCFDRAMFRMLRTGKVGPDFQFKFTKSQAMAYLGFARKS